MAKQLVGRHPVLWRQGQGAHQEVSQILGLYVVQVVVLCQNARQILCLSFFYVPELAFSVKELWEFLALPNELQGKGTKKILEKGEMIFISRVLVGRLRIEEVITR